MENFENELDKMVASIEIKHAPKADTAKQTPIEIALQIDENGQTTARALYEFLEMPSSNFARWAKQNIEKNEFYEENVDWYGFFIVKNGNECKDYRITTDFAKHLCMESHSAKGKTARQYFIIMENKVKDDAINRSELSPQMQMLMSMVEVQAKQELEQKRQAEQINKVEMTVTTMRDIFTEPIGDWQNDINKRVREIAMKSGTPYNEMWGKLYGELEVTAHCSLKRLAENKRKRMQKAGNTKQAIAKGTSKLAIIHDNTRLKLIFEDIVKKYAMAYVGIEKAEV